MRHENKQFIDDSSAAIGMILALAALPTFSAMALAIDHGQAATTYGEIAVLADEACSRVSTPIIRNEPIATQVAAAQTLLDRRIADFGAAGLTATATDVSGDIHIAISGDLASIMPGQFGDFSVDQTLNCSTGAAANANPVATIIFTESFENPLNDPGWSWQVRPSLPNWTTLGGPGVEIHRPAHRPMDPNIFRGQFPTPPEGEQFAELDASFDRGGLPSPTTNTAMATEIFLSVGTYQLSVQYMIKLRANAGNAIDVFMESVDQPPLSSQLGTMDGAANWQTFTYDMVAPVEGWYRLGLRAGGAANDNGGAIDDIVLRRIGP